MWAILKAKLWWIVAAAWVASLAVAATLSWNFRASLCDATMARATQLHQRDLQQQAVKAAEAASRLESRLALLRRTTKETTREVEVIVERPVYRDCVLDNDGVRLLREAREQAAAPAEPADAVR